jgi:hypothetical protein
VILPEDKKTPLKNEDLQSGHFSLKKILLPAMESRYLIADGEEKENI